MNKLLEHIIRENLFESDSPWSYRVIGSETLRGQLVNKLAKESGAKRGVLLKAKLAFVGAPTDMDTLIDGFIDWLETRKVRDNDAPLRDFYNDGKHTYVFLTKKASEKRKTIVLLIYENETYKPLIDAIIAAQTNTQYFKVQPNDDIKMMANNSIRVITGEQYIQWRTDLLQSINELEAETDKIQDPDKAREANAIVNYIQNLYDKLEKNKKFIDTGYRSWFGKLQKPGTGKSVFIPFRKTVDIKNVDGFTGTAELTISADGSKKYTPVQGTQSVVNWVERAKPELGVDKRGWFHGKFASNGMPEEGTVQWNVINNPETINWGGMYRFVGELNPYKDQFTFKRQSVNNPSFSFQYLNGIVEYANGFKWKGEISTNAWPNGSGVLSQQTSEAARKKARDSRNGGDIFLALPDYKKYEFTYKQLIGNMIHFRGNWNNINPTGEQEILDSKFRIIGTYIPSKVETILTPQFESKRNAIYNGINDILKNPFKKDLNEIEFTQITSIADSEPETVVYTENKSNIDDFKIINNEKIERDNIEYYEVSFSIGGYSSEEEGVKTYVKSSSLNPKYITIVVKGDINRFNPPEPNIEPESEIEPVTVPDRVKNMFSGDDNKK